MDDEPAVREVGRRVLLANGYGCVEAESIERALETVKTTQVHAAILDVRLPGRRSGRDVLTEFRSQAELSKIPVLIMIGTVLREAEKASITSQRAYLS